MYCFAVLVRAIYTYNSAECINCNINKMINFCLSLCGSAFKSWSAIMENIFCEMLQHLCVIDWKKAHTTNKWDTVIVLNTVDPCSRYSDRPVTMPIFLFVASFWAICNLQKEKIHSSWLKSEHTPSEVTYLKMKIIEKSKWNSHIDLIKNKITLLLK